MPRRRQRSSSAWVRPPSTKSSCRIRTRPPISWRSSSDLCSRSHLPAAPTPETPSHTARISQGAGPAQRRNPLRWRGPGGGVAIHHTPEEDTLTARRGKLRGRSPWPSAFCIVLITACLQLPFPVEALAGPRQEAERQDCNDYSCPDYLEHDLDNYSRARGRQITEPASPEYHQEFLSACADSSSRAIGKQADDVQDGRGYGGVGQATCWWSVGDAPTYNSVNPERIYFQSRTGAKLQAHLWGTDAPGPRPGIVITTGSIQASEQMYWWAARALAERGYVVLTFDV